MNSGSARVMGWDDQGSISQDPIGVIGSDPVLSQLLTLMRIKNPEGLDSSSSFCSYPLVTGFDSITSAGMWQVGFMGRL